MCPLSLDEISFTPNSLQLLQVSLAARAHTHVHPGQLTVERAQAGELPGWCPPASPRDHCALKRGRYELVFILTWVCPLICPVCISCSINTA